MSRIFVAPHNIYFFLDSFAVFCLISPLLRLSVVQLYFAIPKYRGYARHFARSNDALHRAGRAHVSSTVARLALAKKTFVCSDVMLCSQRCRVTRADAGEKDAR